MKHQKIILPLIVLLIAIVPDVVRAQRYVDDDSDLKERFYFGGNFRLQFGDLTQVEVSPLAGFMVTEDLSVGAGIIYQYFRIRETSQTFGYETNIYGGKLFVRHNVSDKLFAYSEYENINLDALFETVNGVELQRVWIPAFFIGGGYFQSIGDRSGVNIMVLYNVLHSVQSPYNSPFVLRLGFSI